jgi:hypothetical protein
MENKTRITNAEGEGSIKIEQSILRRAINNDPEALSLMFHQFIPPNEEIRFAEFLGVNGLWGVGDRCFGCATEKRIASIRVGAFKEVIYQDGYLEHINSGVVYQPSKLKMYIFMVVATIISLYISSSLWALIYSLMNPRRGVMVDEDFWLPFIFGLVVLIALSPLTWIVAAQLYYRVVKCGLVWSVREGVNIYVFANRNKLIRANHLYRISTELRDERIRQIREPI